MKHSTISKYDAYQYQANKIGKTLLYFSFFYITETTWDKLYKELKEKYPDDIDSKLYHDILSGDSLLTFDSDNDALEVNDILEKYSFYVLLFQPKKD